MSDVVQIGKRGSTAASTDFVSHKFVGPDGRHLWVDGNQKISGWKPVPNAFSLVEIEDCPGATESCKKACYVHGLKKHAPQVHELFVHNSETIRSIVRSCDRPNREDWAWDFAAYISEHCRETGFRWHVSGDVFSERYADWIREVVTCSTVDHWIYTRSFELAGPLVGLENLALNFSCDRDNYEAARYWREKYARRDGSATARLCYLTSDGHVPDDLPEGSVVFPDYGLRERDLAPAVARGASVWYQELGPVARAGLCPVDFYGKAENRRCSPSGACSKCLVQP